MTTTLERPPLTPTASPWPIAPLWRDVGDQPGIEVRGGALPAALATLGEHSREVILLKDIQGLSLEEIAQMLGAPIGTIKSRCNRARIELARKVMELTGEA